MSLSTQLHRGLFGLALIVALSTIGLVKGPNGFGLMVDASGAPQRLALLHPDCDTDDCAPPRVERLAWHADAGDDVVVRIEPADAPDADAEIDPVRMQDLLPGIMFRCSTSSCSSRKSRPTRAM